MTVETAASEWGLSRGDDQQVVTPHMGRRRRGMFPIIDHLAAYSWRLLLIGLATTAMVWLIGRLWAVFLPLVVAAFLIRVLADPTRALRSRGWPPGAAAAAVLVGFVVVTASAVSMIAVASAGSVDRIAPTISVGIDDIETWLVDDAPVDISRADLDEFRNDAGAAAGRLLRDSSGSIVRGVVVTLEVLVSAVLGLIITFFGLKDGHRLTSWLVELIPSERRGLATRLSRRSWRTLGGYLRGAAILGVVEGIAIGLAVALVGGELAVPVGVFTFIMAFIPLVGAMVAGALAVLVTLATAGGVAALVVLAVAIIVQQLDNDLLAPWVYGSALNIHPVVVLLSVTAGGALFGIVGTLLAVPLTAVVVNTISEARIAPGTTGG